MQSKTSIHRISASTVITHFAYSLSKIEVSSSMAVLWARGMLRVAEGYIQLGGKVADACSHTLVLLQGFREVSKAQTPIYLEFPSKAFICFLLLALIT